MLVQELEWDLCSRTFEVQRLDHGHKNSKRVCECGERVFEATLTAMNERNQILGVWHGGTSLVEMRAVLARMAARNTASTCCHGCQSARPCSQSATAAARGPCSRQLQWRQWRWDSAKPPQHPR
jgi:hypothetical protein